MNIVQEALVSTDICLYNQDTSNDGFVNYQWHVYFCYFYTPGMEILDI